MTEAKQNAETVVPEHHSTDWAGLTVAALFGLLYAYGVWGAIGNLDAVPKLYELLGLSASTPWVLLYSALAIPVLVYVVAFVIGRHRGLAERALLLLLGLGVANALALGAIALNSRIYSDLIHRI